jgi:hypothetical protein
LAVGKDRVLKYMRMLGIEAIVSKKYDIIDIEVNVNNDLY